MHPLIIMVLMDVKYWAMENELPFIVTETVTTMYEDIQVDRKSSSHRTGRAFDLSIRDWNNLDIKDCVNHFNKKYNHIAATSSSNGKPNLIIDHVGTARHLHFQIHSKYSLNIEKLPLQ